MDMPGEITHTCVIRHSRIPGRCAPFGGFDASTERCLAPVASCSEREVSTVAMIDSKPLKSARCGRVARGYFDDCLFPTDRHGPLESNPTTADISGPDINPPATR